MLISQRKSFTHHNYKWCMYSFILQTLTQSVDFAKAILQTSSLCMLQSFATDILQTSQTVLSKVQKHMWMSGRIHGIKLQKAYVLLIYHKYLYWLGQLSAYVLMHYLTVFVFQLYAHHRVWMEENVFDLLIFANVNLISRASIVSWKAIMWIMIKQGTVEKDASYVFEKEKDKEKDLDLKAAKHCVNMLSGKQTSSKELKVPTEYRLYYGSNKCCC